MSLEADTGVEEVKELIKDKTTLLILLLPQHRYRLQGSSALFYNQ